jgi:hypothetical protein
MVHLASTMLIGSELGKGSDLGNLTISVSISRFSGPREHLLCTRKQQQDSYHAAHDRNNWVTMLYVRAAAGNLFLPGSRELVSMFDFKTHSRKINFDTDPTLDAV